MFRVMGLLFLSVMAVFMYSLACGSSASPELAALRESMTDQPVDIHKTHLKNVVIYHYPQDRLAVFVDTTSQKILITNPKADTDWLDKWLKSRDKYRTKK